jgi:Enoyl-(Acyl carrier protein) reductase
MTRDSRWLSPRLVPRGQACAGGHARRRQPDLQLERRRPAVGGGDLRLRDVQARDRRAHAHGREGGCAARHPCQQRAPGPVDNSFQRTIEVDVTGAPPERAAELFEENIPLGRHAAPEEIARTVLFLASGDSSFVTGATLSVDGGMSD